MSIEVSGHAAKCHPNHIYLLQNSALCVILTIRPGGHVTYFFSVNQIMPLEMLLDNPPDLENTILVIDEAHHVLKTEL